MSCLLIFQGHSAVRRVGGCEKLQLRNVRGCEFRHASVANNNILPAFRWIAGNPEEICDDDLEVRPRMRPFLRSNG